MDEVCSTKSDIETKPHCRSRLRRLPFLLVLFAAVVYFLVLPVFVPVPEVKVDVRGETVGGVPVVYLVAKVTSWTGDYMLESARKPRLHIAQSTQPLNMRIRPLRARPGLASRYLIAKRTTTFDFTAEPLLPDGISSNTLTTGTAEVRLRLYAEHDPPIVNDIYYDWQRLTSRGTGNPPSNLSTRLLHLRQQVTFQ